MNNISISINERIEAIKSGNNVYDIGRVVKMSNYIIEVSGLSNAGFYERVEIAGKAKGYVSRIGKNSVTIELIRIFAPIYVGDEVKATGETFKIAYSAEELGHVVDIFGNDKMTGKTFKNLMKIPAIPEPIPIMKRGTVNRPLYTGLAAIDLLYPIGKGQRQLIIGDKKTGKTQIGLDAIANQKGKDCVCIYVALGKTKKNVKEIVNDLMKRGAMEYTLILTAFTDDGAPALFMTPNAALSIANLYMRLGKDVLVVIDDLTSHANVYREVSLLSGKVPGRDSYPPDMFYTHASLLEQGCQLEGGGSITILPIIETRGGDITDYVATNVISITDGQIVLSSKSFEKGQKPAVNFGLSVSRLGGQVQDADMKKVGTGTRRELLSFLETKEVFELANIDEMNETLRNQILNGRKMLDNMVQYKYSPLDKKEIIRRFDNSTEVK